jgi:hypothetical protein
MPRAATVRHEAWIAAPIATVRPQFADVEHPYRATGAALPA